VKNASIGLSLAMVFLFVLSCGLINRFTTGGVENMQRAEDLWPDVPRIDGLEHSDMELPLAGKLLVRWALNNMWRLNKEGEDRTPATGDWVVFSTVKTPTDIESFYTNDRMTQFGQWETSKKSTCFDGKDKGWPGILCVYQKKESDKTIGLMILAGTDEDSKKTNVFYLRVESPTNSNSNSSK